MLFDAPAQMKKLGVVKILRKIQIDKSNLSVVAKALGMDPKIKGMTTNTIYVVQEAPDVLESSNEQPNTTDGSS